MANRFWVGGTGSWTSSATANWSTTSGGAGGASAPTLNDDVFFDAGSDAGGIFTVTIGTGAVCRDITVAGLDQVMTLAGNAAWSIYGSLAFPATNLTRTYTGAITFAATTTGKTITTNGLTLTTGGTTFNGVGGEWTLGGAFVTGGTLALSKGVLDVSVSNYSVTCGAFSSASNKFTPRLGTLNVTNNSVNFLGGTNTYYDVVFTNATAGGGAVITGANTFNNLTFTSPSATGLRNISVAANQTVNGTLTLGTANTAIRRMFMFSDVVGIPRTITANAIAALADVDFRDTVAAGASGTWAGTRLGNCLGNSNITFDAGKTVYWNLAGAQNWSANGWALINNGAPAVNNFPLAQDTATFTEAGAAGTVTLDFGWNVGTLTFADGVSNRSTAMTLAFGTTTPKVYGDFKAFANLVTSGTGATTFAGQGITQNITCAGATLTINSIVVDNKNGTIKLADTFRANRNFTLTTGTLDLNSKDFYLTASFASTNANIRTINFGAGKFYLGPYGGATTGWDCSTATNLTISGTPIVNYNVDGAAGNRFAAHGNSAGGSELNAVSFVITGSQNPFGLFNGSAAKNLDYSGFTNTLLNYAQDIYGNVIFSSGLTPPTTTVPLRFAASSGNQTLTTNGKTLDFPITKQGAGTLQLADNLTQGVTRTFTHTAGTIDLNDNDLNAGLWSTTGAVARHLDTGATGELHIAGATFTASGSNLTTEGTGSISMDSASAKTFAGGGFSWPVINQGGAGDLNLTGANRFKDMTNTVAPCAVVFPANVTTQVENFSLNGTPGNLVSIRSSVAGQRFGLDKVAA